MVIRPTARRGLLLAGLAVAAWSTVRVGRLLAGDDSVVADDDPHGYAAIFSLVLVPVLVVAVVSLVTAIVRDRVHGVAPGVTLALSAPLAGPLAIAALTIGTAIIASALLGKRALTNGGPGASE